MSERFKWVPWYFSVQVARAGPTPSLALDSDQSFIHSLPQFSKEEAAAKGSLIRTNRIVTAMDKVMTSPVAKSEQEKQLRCPRCDGLEIQRSKHRGIERLYLKFLKIRPYRCSACDERFYGPAEN